MKSVDQDGKCRTESDCDWIVKNVHYMQVGVDSDAMADGQVHSSE